MPPDEHTRKIIGAMGGTLLGACAMPQIIRLIRTKSASDISYVFLLAYILGLFLTFLYLFWKRALITWICILIQLGHVDAVGVGETVDLLPEDISEGMDMRWLWVKFLVRITFLPTLLRAASIGYKTSPCRVGSGGPPGQGIPGGAVLQRTEDQKGSQGAAEPGKAGAGWHTRVPGLPCGAEHFTCGIR
uniref:Uncharacterized protein n=1 Tax=Auxenochlorella protothecoides TaxID=3075 RepID=A0A1D2AFJ1_AUXPR